MYTYHIKHNGYTIGQAVGKHKAFEYIQKEIERSGLLGYWREEKYLCDNKDVYSIERGNEL